MKRAGTSKGCPAFIVVPLSRYAVIVEFYFYLSQPFVVE